MSETQEKPFNAAKLKVRIEGLRDVNRGMIQEVQSVGGTVELAAPRVEKFAEFLMEKGLISEEDRLREQEAWELHLRDNLKPIVEKVRTLASAAGADVQTRSGLIIPGKNGQQPQGR